MALGATPAVAVGCSLTSSWGQQRGQRLNGYAKGGITTRLWTDIGGFYASLPAPLRDRLEEHPVCVLRGLNGASREDSESVSNHHPSTKPNLPRQSTSVLKSIIQEIEPLDISLISKDVSPDSSDAMKRTISGMLGLLPSDQFQVTIESSREPLARLLVSSMMTGYTLRNGEYHLCLKQSLENMYTESSDDTIKGCMVEEHTLEMVSGVVDMDVEKQGVERVNSSICINGDSSELMERVEQMALPDELGAVSPEVAEYIQQLEAKLTTCSKELEDSKHALAALEMESMAGEETNNLLDYLRSLEPEKVAELSQPTSPEVEMLVNDVIEGLLANLCVGNAPSEPPFSKTYQEIDASQVLGNTPMQFQSKVTTSRDYLARLLFWCMLLGHYMLAVEYRLDLNRTLSLSRVFVQGMERSRHT